VVPVREQQAPQAAAPAPAVTEGVGASGARDSVAQGGSNCVEVPTQQATAAQNSQEVVQAPSNPVERRVQTVTAGLTEY
jgi:hypothetical protein